MEKLKNTFFSMICFASRRSGKSCLIKHIYNKLDLGNEYDHVVVISESLDTIDFFSEFVHGNLFIKKFDPHTIDKLIEQSEKLETSGKKKKFLVIIDDVVGAHVKYNDALVKLYAIGRHYRISFIIICQQLTLINTAVRENSDIILIGQSKSARAKNAIIDNFLDGIADDDEIEKMGFATKKNFYNSLIKYHTEDYNFIVLNYMESKRNDFNNITFFTKADIEE